jgi:hypothetical protein
VIFVMLTVAVLLAVVDWVFILFFDKIGLY